jgi:hypothetical protein
MRHHPLTQKAGMAKQAVTEMVQSVRDDDRSAFMRTRRPSPRSLDRFAYRSFEV